ncbi:MAG: ABC transporter permease, partial [Holophagales bacterium]|nr:ABC transporter permease [Holophagales bacterium]
FLYGLPVRRIDLWVVKMVFGLLLSALIVAAVATVMLAFRVDQLATWLQVADSLEVDLRTIAGLLAALSFYNFAAGLFSATASGSARTMGLVNIAFVYLPFLGLWLAESRLDAVPELDRLALLFLATSAPFLVGSLWLFVRRNPFHERPWQRRLGAGVFVAIAAGVFGLSAVLAVRDAGAGRPASLERVAAFEISPDGERVLVANQERLIHTRGLVYDAAGNLLHDFGRAFSMPVNPRLAWRPGAGSTGTGQLLYRDFDAEQLFDPDGVAAVETPFVLVDLGTGERRDIAHRMTGPDTYVGYLGWTPDGAALVGAVSRVDGATEIFVQDLATGTGENLDARFAWEPEMRGGFLVGAPAEGSTEGVPGAGGDESAASESTGLSDPGASTESETSTDSAGSATPNAGIGDDASDTEVLLVDLESRAASLRRLPAETEEWQLTFDGRALVWLERRVEEERAGYALRVEDLASGERRTLLEGDPLPSASLADAARGLLDAASLGTVDHPDWTRLTVYRDSGESATYLVSIPDGRVVALTGPSADGAADGELHFAPGPGVRFAVTWSDPSDAEHRSGVRIFEIEDDAARIVLEASEPGMILSLAWLGSDRLLCTHLESLDLGAGLPRTRLRQIDATTGEWHPWPPPAQRGNRP